MTRTRSIVRFGALGLGFGVAWLVCQWLPDWIRSERMFRIDEPIRAYCLFDPANAAKEKHVLLDTCYSINQVACNVPALNVAVRRHEVARLSNLLNLMVRREFEPSKAEFYGVGYGGASSADHVGYLAHILEVPNVRTIVYSNEPDGMVDFPPNQPELLLRIETILDVWRKQYPALAPHLETYRQALLQSEGYAQVRKAASDPKWRRRALGSDVLPRAYDQPCQSLV